MTASYDLFNSLLPLLARENLSADVQSGVQKETIEGLPSFFNVRVSNGGLLSSSALYDGWCLDPDRRIGLRGYDVSVYSSYGDIPSTVLPDGVTQPVDPPDPDPYLDSLQEINWIFNNILIAPVIQDPAGTTRFYEYTDPLTNTTYLFTQGDVQRAIWGLTGSDTDVPSSRLGPSTDVNVAIIIDLAITNGQNFLAQAGDYIGVLLDPGANSNGVLQQPAIIQVRTAGIGDTVFFDSNSNGIADDGEGLNGVTVKLLVDKGDGSGFQVVGTTVTGDNPHTPAIEDGYYFFGPLLAGPDGGTGITYQVMVDTTTLPGGGVGWSNTVDPDGGNDNMSSEVLTPGEVNLEQDFGYQAFDYGDAPDSYGTTLDADGARHLLSIGQTAAAPLLKLGTLIDTESDGFPSVGADGDNNNNLNDEDGITFTAITAGQSFTVTANVMEDSANVDGRLNAWIDFNADGDFDDPGEQIISDAAVINGSNAFLLNAPVDAVSGNTYARFRLSSDPAAQNPTGLATDGEVEDYLVTIGGGNDQASLGNFVFDDLNANGVQDPGEPGVAGVTVNLYKDTNGDGFGDLFLETQITDAQGLYLFDNLAPNMDYQVEFILPDDFISFTLPNAIPPANDTTDSDADPATGRAPVVTLAPGEFNDTIDAGLLKPAAIGDFVFKDLNGNGIQDPGEPGVEGVKVTLTGTDVFGNPVDRMATTDANGEYLFNGDTLLPGTYKVTFSDLAPNHAFTVPDQGGNDATDSDADPTNGMTPFVTVGSGESNLTLDAGLVGTGIEIIKFVNGDDANAPTGPILTVGDVVTFTYEVRNTGNVSLANVVVLDDNGTPGNPADDFNPVFTGGDTNNNTWLDLGEIWTYEASSTVLEGQYTNIATTTGTPIYPPGTNNPNFPPGTEVPNLPPPTDDDPGNYLGVPTPVGSIGDEIFFDKNSNGIRDAGEGFAGVTVGLDITGDGVADIFDVTDAQGFYLFDGLEAGDYKVIVDTTTLPDGGQPITYQNTTDPDGGNDSMSMLTLAPGEDNLLQDFGYQAFDYGDAPDSYGTTDANDGARHLISVGQTTGSPLLKFGSTVDSEPDGQPNAAASGDDLNLDFGGPVPPNADDEDGITFDPITVGENFTVFVNVMEDSANVNGRLNAWIDFNADGDFDDPGEQIISDAGVLNGDNEFIVDVPVDAVAGNTYARFRLSSDPAAQNPTGLATDGEVEDYLVTINAPDQASLGDFVFDDLNADGVQDPGEPGVAGVTVNLYKDTNGDGFGDLFLETQLTDAQGGYLFDGLAPNMDYQVEFILPDDFVSFTLPNAIPPANDATDSDADPATGRAPVVTLAPGEFNPTIDAGLLKPAAIGDFVFKDLNGNGIQDPGEPGVEGVKVTLTGTDVFGNPVDRMTTTDANGEYLFNGDTLLPGTYKVTFSDLAPNHAFTVPDQGGNDATDSDANPLTGMTPFVTVGSGESNLTLDAGLVGTGIDIIKFVNGDDANNATGPILTVGDVVTFTYEVRNTGNVSLANVVVLDDNGTPGNPADDFNPVFTGGDTNNNSWLDLGEIWTYEASSTVLEGQYTNIATTTGTPIYPPGTNNPNFPPGTEVPNLPPPTDDDPGNYFGVPTLVGSIGDEIFFDKNSNGIRDAGEGLAGITVGLDTTGDGVANIFDVTDAQGFYLFDGLDAGDYKVIVDTTTLPDGGIGFVNTVDPDGGNNSMSDVVLGAGENNLLQDFGYLAFDFGDAPNRYDTRLGRNGPRHVLSIGQSDATPLLKLGSLIDTELDGQPNSAARGDNNNNLNDEDGITFTAITAGQSFTVTANVMEDSANVDGRLNAWIDFNADGDFDDPGEQIISDAAVDNGDNSFIIDAPIDAVAGNTYARFRLSSDPAAQNPTGLATDGEVEDYRIAINAAEQASLGDFVFDDLNANGVQDPGEPGVAGVTVNLYKDTNGDGFGDLFLETQITDAQGLYLFDNLAPNMDYQVEFILPDDFISFTLPNAIPPANDTTDSDADPATGRAPVVTLAPGEFNDTIDAGLLKPAAIGDFVFKDLNGNGIQDPGEPGVEGVKVTLTGTDVFGNPVDRMTTTDANGEYLFNGDTLLPGTYKVTFSDLAPNHAFTVPDQGGNDATDSDADPTNGMTPFVTVGSGESNLTLDAGLVGTGIEIIKFVNGDDANAPTGPILTVGDVVTFTYEVRNTGNVSLANVVVLDDNGTPGNPADDFNPVFTGGDTNNNTWLDLGEIWTYEASSTVLEGQYTNIATTTGTPIYPPGTNNPNFPPGTEVPNLPPPTDDDPGNYLGVPTIGQSRRLRL